MIRRWSLVNSFTLLGAVLSTDNSRSLSTRNQHWMKKKTKISFYRSLVVSRRFNRKMLTKFKRKAYNRIRHRTNWVIYNNILKFWALDYLHNKYPAKFEFTVKIFVDTFFFYNFNFVKNKNPEGFANWNFCYINKVHYRFALPSPRWAREYHYPFSSNLGSACLGFSDILWDNAPGLNNFANIDEKETSLYLNNLAVPACAFWDEQTFTSMHCLQNYATSHKFESNFIDITSNPSFDFSLIYDDLLNLHFLYVLNARSLAILIISLNTFSDDFFNFNK